MAPHASKFSGDNAMPVSRTHLLQFAATLGAILIAGLTPRQACAALGEAETSIQTDVVALQASIKTLEDRTIYRLHEIQLPSGTLLREFVSPDGKVFAVAWNGPRMPDLRQAFGQYFDSFVAGAKLNHGDHSHLLIEQSDLVVQIRGHMRAYSGRAYLPAAIPSGVDVGDLR
jgi:Protein of unknown function (DUF2844)